MCLVKNSEYWYKYIFWRKVFLFSSIYIKGIRKNYLFFNCVLRKQKELERRETKEKREQKKIKRRERKERTEQIELERKEEKR